MLNCEDIAKLISESMDHQLPWSRRMAVKFHLTMCRCPVCQGYVRQMEAFRSAIHTYRNTLLERPVSETDKLPDQAVVDIKAALKRNA